MTHKLIKYIEIDKTYYFFLINEAELCNAWCKYIFLALFKIK